MKSKQFISKTYYTKSRIVVNRFTHISNLLREEKVIRKKKPCLIVVHVNIDAEVQLKWNLAFFIGLRYSLDGRQRTSQIGFRLSVVVQAGARCTDTVASIKTESRHAFEMERCYHRCGYVPSIIERYMLLLCGLREFGTCFEACRVQIEVI